MGHFGSLIVTTEIHGPTYMQCRIGAFLLHCCRDRYSTLDKVSRERPGQNRDDVSLCVFDVMRTDVVP